MPRNGQGLYSLPEAAFVPGSTISSAAVNSDFSDIASALTDSIAADGQTPVSAPLKFPDGSSVAPAITFNTNTNDGFFHPSAGSIGIALAGVQAFTITSVTASAGSGLLGPSNTILIPLGIVLDYAGPTAPIGWFFPYGQAVSRTTYIELFQVIGTAFGAGDGSTTFNLPDCRGRVNAGRDDMGGSAASRLTSVTMTPNGTALNAVGGLQIITVAQNQLPNVTLTFSGTAAVSSSVADILRNPAAQQVTPSGAGGGVGTGTVTGSVINSSGTASGNTSSINGNATQQNIGIVQPTIIVNKIIFAGHP